MFLHIFHTINCLLIELESYNFKKRRFTKYWKVRISYNKFSSFWNKLNCRAKERHSRPNIRFKNCKIFLIIFIVQVFWVCYLWHFCYKLRLGKIEPFINSQYFLAVFKWRKYSMILEKRTMRVWSVYLIKWTNKMYF